jgi:hypothetical protein
MRDRLVREMAEAGNLPSVPESWHEMKPIHDAVKIRGEDEPGFDSTRDVEGMGVVPIVKWWWKT